MTNHVKNPTCIGCKETIGHRVTICPLLFLLGTFKSLPTYGDPINKRSPKCPVLNSLMELIRDRHETKK